MKNLYDVEVGPPSHNGGGESFSVLATDINHAVSLAQRTAARRQKLYVPILVIKSIVLHARKVIER